MGTFSEQVLLENAATPGILGSQRTSFGNYAPEFEAPSETAPAILLQGTEHFEPHIGMRHPNPPLPPVAGEPDKSSLASN